MDDWPRSELEQLAPIVDEEASRREFDVRRQDAPTRRPRYLAAAAAAALLVAGTATIAGITGDGGPDARLVPPGGTVADTTTPLERPRFDVLAVTEIRTRDQARRAAVTMDQLIEIRQTDDVDFWRSVDFRDEIVVVIDEPAGACYSEIVGFDVDERVLTPRLEAPDECRIPTTTVPGPTSSPVPTVSDREYRPHRWYVALERAQLTPEFTLRSSSTTPDPDVEPIDITVPDLDGLPPVPRYEQIDVENPYLGSGIARVATDATELRELWSVMRFSGAPPEVDFDDRVILAFTAPGTGCGERLDGFDVDAQRRWTVLLRNRFRSGGCRPGAPSTFVVAVERSAAAPSFVLRMVDVDSSQRRPEVLEKEFLVDATTPTTPAKVADPAFDVLVAEQTGGRRRRALRAATDVEELRTLWAEHGLSGAPPSVDFSSRVVVAWTITGNVCLEEVGRFDVVGDVWTAVMAGTGTPCFANAYPATYVVALDRAAAAPAFTLRMTRENGGGELRVEVPDDEPAPDSVPPAKTTPATPPPGTDPPAEPEGANEYELVDVQAGPDTGVLRSAVDGGEYEALWKAAQLEARPPRIDFNAWIVASIAIADDACPPAFDGFTIEDDDAWIPRFVEGAGYCDEPLIPKTYVVKILRSTAAPGLTLRLPQDLSGGSDAQTLDIDVDAVSSPPVTPPPPSQPPLLDPFEWRLPLPARGGVRSVLAPDGTPLWLIHHYDGTASAVPAVVPVGNTFGNEMLGVEQAARVLRWAPEQRWFMGSVSYDEYGRALNSGRDDDLADYVAVVDGDDVVVSPRNGTISGSPNPSLGEPSFGEAIAPDLPVLTDLPDELAPGWSQIDADLVGTEGDWRICDVDDSPPVDQLDRCDDGGIAATGLTGDVPDEGTAWYFGPLVVHVGSNGEIDLISPTGGMAGAAG